MILMLRGHIRDSFNNMNLYFLISNIYSNNKDLTIYIHTWNIIQNSLSWRKLNPNNTPVTEEMIRKYFRNFACLIKHIIIEDDKKINLKGTVTGPLTSIITGFPILAWKNYWYGKNSLIEYLKNVDNINNEIIVNMRFDILKNSYSLTQYEIINFINNNKNIDNIKKNIFLKDHFFCGIDNIYIGTFYTQNKLISYFNNYLDNILAIYGPQNIGNQERFVYEENNRLFKLK